MANSLSINAQSELFRSKQLYMVSENYLILVRTHKTKSWSKLVKIGQTWSRKDVGHSGSSD